MQVKINIIKVTADGEQLSIDADISPNEIRGDIDLLPQLKPYFKLADDRMFEMNKRIISSGWMAKRLTPEEQMHLHEVIEMLHGRKPASVVDEMYQEATDNVDRQAANALRKAKAVEEAANKKLPQTKPKEGIQAGNGVTDINTKGKK